MPDDLTELLEEYADRWLELSDAERIAALGLVVRVVVRLDGSATTLVERSSRFDWRSAIATFMACATGVGLPIAAIIVGAQ